MRPLLIGAFVVSSLAFAACGTTVKPGYRGIKYIALDNGAVEKEVRSEGFYFQWPWNDIITYKVTWQTTEEAVDILTKDDLHVPTRVAVTFRPRESELYELHTKIGKRYYAEVIRPAFVTLVRNEFSAHRHNDLSRATSDIESTILKKLKVVLKGKPLDVDQISVTHIAFDQSVTTSISAKLVKEQVSQQKRFEVVIAEQDAEIARTKAKGRGDAIRLEAEGQARAIVLKGQAQSEAQKAIASTLDKKYLQYKAFDGNSTRYYFVPTGKDGMPIIIDAAK
jgi:regulator of protease activity HflC (stomatin/prohibitin superfamily)